MSTGTLHSSDAPVTEEKGVHILKGSLCEFKLWDDLPTRRWFTITRPFSEIRKIFKVEPYDPVKGKGEQRNRIDSYVKKLIRVTKAGKYTPAPWAGGIRDSHLKNVEIDEKKKTVSIRVTERNPLPCLDGGHRFETLLDMWKEFATDKPKQAAIDALPITVTVYLDPEFIRRDFENLQARKAVSRSQLKFMSENEDLATTDPKKGHFQLLGKRVACTLNRLSDSESFMSNDINFVGGSGGGVEYASITTMGGSDIGTSIIGGAKIVLWEGFKPHFKTNDEAADFLVQCYKAVWQGIYEYDDKSEFTDQTDGAKLEFPNMLMAGRMLRPYRLKGGGTKGGTGLLIMLGNMLAFRMLSVRRKTKIMPDDVKRLVKAAQETLDQDVQGGGSGTAKREATGEFVRVYFEDVVRKGEEDEHDLKKLAAIDGVPVLLCDKILSRSTLNVAKDAVQYIVADPAEGVDENGRADRMSDPDQTDPEWKDEDSVVGQADISDEEEAFTPPPPTKKGAKTAVMG